MAKAKSKTTNYTEQQISRMREVYTGTNNVKEVTELSAEFGKSIPSVRAKLANLGIYVKDEKASKAKGENKFSIAEKIGEVVNLQEHEVEGLAKATKSSLEKILGRLTNNT